MVTTISIFVGVLSLLLYLKPQCIWVTTRPFINKTKQKDYLQIVGREVTPPSLETKYRKRVKVSHL